MGIEALWTVQFGDYEEPHSLKSGGVLVFESGRLFGGDSGTYYRGTYTLKDGRLNANVKVLVFDDNYETIFEPGSVEAEIRAKGCLRGDKVIRGRLVEDGKSEQEAIGFEMKRRAELP